MDISPNLYPPIAIALAILIFSIFLYRHWSTIIFSSIEEINALTITIKNEIHVNKNIFEKAIDTTKNKRIKDLLEESKRNLL